MEMDINGVSQVSLLVQGKSNSMPSSHGGFCLFCVILVSQTGLIKQARPQNTYEPNDILLNNT
jgi:hypothetical protein